MDESENQIEPGEAVPFTARLIAYHRAEESRRIDPLIVDPYAERLAGDMRDYLAKHIRASRGDYSIVRSYYVESRVLTRWCAGHPRSQVVLVGAGLDTRAYRFEPLREGRHIVFEIDLPVVHRYKKAVLSNEHALCEVVQVSADVALSNWHVHLMESGFSADTPAIWISEGLAYYIDRASFAALLRQAAELSADRSEVFVDVCVPALAEMRFGTFTMHFKWGLEKSEASGFFSDNGWKVSCSYADEHDQGRDVGQRGFIFVNGERRIT